MKKSANYCALNDRLANLWPKFYQSIKFYFSYVATISVVKSDQLHIIHFFFKNPFDLPNFYCSYVTTWFLIKYFYSFSSVKMLPKVLSANRMLLFLCHISFIYKGTLLSLCSIFCSGEFLIINLYYATYLTFKSKLLPIAHILNSVLYIKIFHVTIWKHYT